jgi:molybdenum cofactor synthesis domain-containing protein
MTLTAAVLVASDRCARGEREDASGRVMKERLESQGIVVSAFDIVPDDVNVLTAHLIRFCDELHVDVVLTTGGTGLGPRDVTPEATASVVHRQIPGMAELLRSSGQRRTPYAMLSRGIAGTRGATIIINLPGSVGGVTDGLDALLPSLVHAVAMIRGGGHEEPLELSPSVLPLAASSLARSGDRA